MINTYKNKLCHKAECGCGNLKYHRYRVLIHIIPVKLGWWSDGMNPQQLVGLGTASDTGILVHNEMDRLIL
jgi:hypothetical protein